MLSLPRVWRILWHGSYKAAHPAGEWQRLWVISWSFCIYRREGPTTPWCHHTQSLDTVYMLPPACLPCVKLDISSVIQMSPLALTTFSRHVRWLCLASSSSLAVKAELHLLFPSFICSVQCLVFALKFATHIELLPPVTCVNSVVHPFTCDCTKCRESYTLFLISLWTNYHLSDQLNIRKKGKAGGSCEPSSWRAAWAVYWNFPSKTKQAAGDAQWLKALAAAPENLELCPRTHIR